jgi:microcystin-dependent protein
MSGAMIAFVPHVTSGAAPTLNVDGLGAKQIRAAPSVELPDGALVAGSPYVATYFIVTNEWVLQGGAANPYSIPLGGMLPYIGVAAPNSAFALPFGQAISRSVYATLFALVGTTYGAGDGSTTFNIPDVRGRVAAGKDDMGGNAASRLTSTYFGTSAAALGAVGGAENRTLTAAQIPAHTHSGTTATESATHSHAVTANARNNVLLGGGGSDTVPASGGGASFSSTQVGAESSTHTHNFTTDNGTGGGTAHATVQPTIVVNYILRII